MIVNVVLDYWRDLFIEKLKDDTDDELKMVVVKKAPFQDDPIRKAPYLLIGEDIDKGVVLESQQEIGGSVWWIANLKIRASPKSQKTPERAYYLVELLGQRIVWLLRKYSFAHPSGQGIPSLQNRDWNFIVKITHKVYGGESEWLSYVEIEFFQRSL